jgi:GDP-L-fucose synthase
MRVVIFGASGFLGTALRKRLRRADVELHCPCHEEVDLLDVGSIANCLQGGNSIDVIYNLVTHGGSLNYVSRNPAQIYQDNVTYALNLYSMADPDTLIINPISNCSYPASSEIQRESEWLYYISQANYEQFGQRTINLVFPNMYGPGGPVEAEKNHALNGMVIRMLEAKKAGDTEFVIWGTGSPVREWIYVEDAARALDRANRIYNSNADIKSCWPINVGQARGYSITETAMMIMKACEFDADLAFDTDKIDGDPTKILSQGSYMKHFQMTFTPIELGILNTVEYYEEKLACVS